MSWLNPQIKVLFSYYLIFELLSSYELLVCYSRTAAGVGEKQHERLPQTIWAPHTQACRSKSAPGLGPAEKHSHLHEASKNIWYVIKLIIPALARSKEAALIRTIMEERDSDHYSS